MTHDRSPHHPHGHTHAHDHDHGHGHIHGPERHDHAHGHHHHHHGVTSANERRALLAAALTGGFMLAELVGGLLTGSLALLADAAHMLTDFAALSLAWIAFRLSRRPADPRRSYGFDRLQILAAFANAVTLGVLAVWIAAEAVTRLLDPQPVAAAGMAAIAALGLAVNVAAFLILHGADRDNLNIQGALAHVMGDLLGSVAALLAAGVILLTGFLPADPLLSLGIAVLIAISAVRLVRASGRVLLEAAPEGLDPDAVRADLARVVPGVEDVHHLHVWCITPERPMATLHVRLASGTDSALAVAEVKARLAERWAVTHATVEAEFTRCADR